MRSFQQANPMAKTSKPEKKADVVEALEARCDSESVNALIAAQIGWVWATDREHRFSYLPKEFTEQTGLETDPLIGKTRFELISKAAQENAKIRQHIEDLKAQRPFFNFIYEIGQGTSQSRWLSISGMPQFDDAGVFNGYVGTGQDVTEMVAAQIETDVFRRDLEHTTALLTATCDQLDAGLIVFDSDARLVLANSLIKTQFSASSHAMVEGAGLRDVLAAMYDNGRYHEADEAYNAMAREAWIDAKFECWHEPTSESELQLLNGRWVHLKRSRRENGLLVGLCVDVTDIKQREVQLQEVVEKTRLAEEILNGLDMAVTVKDSKFRYVFVNDRFAALSKRPPSIFIGKTASELFPADQAAKFEESEKLVLESGSLQETEEDFVRDGQAKARMVRKSLVTTESGRRYVAISLIDITEIRQRERLLAEAQQKAMLSDRAKSEFLANMSHEIRTPMNGVLGMAELLAKTELDTKQRTFTDIIVKSGNALLTIINDILDFSKIDAGQMVLDPAPFDIAEAVEDVATLVSTRAKEKDLELIVRIDPSMPRAFFGDAGRIRQIITNLMGNAVKFTEYGHVLVDITGRQDGDEWRIHCRVVDTGIGIPEDKLSQVFEKFSQVDASSTRRHEGTGLGLAITSKLVELMGGTIGAESKPGEGSAFWFEITVPAYEGAIGDVPVTPVDISGSRVLVIDDNPVNCQILLEQMRAWEFDACAAESGEMGLAVLETAQSMECPVDLVVLDYQMPDMNGAQVLAAIRSNEKIRDVPIVMLTSVDQALSVEMLKAYDVDQHLLKPARSAHLLDAIITSIQSRRVPRLIVQRDEPGESPDASVPPVISAQAEEPADVPAAPEPERPETWSSTRLDILVAEDNEVNQLVYTQILSDLPYTFEIVSNGRLAVESCAENNPRLILMDISMPELNGLEATAAIRESGATDLPIIGVTAHALKGDSERCLAAGMNDYLSKPISPDALASKIRYWLEKTERARKAQ